MDSHNYNFNTINTLFQDSDMETPCAEAYLFILKIRIYNKIDKSEITHHS